MKKEVKGYNVLDLFAGCGGLSKGFEQAGFNIIAANEFWEPAAKTYMKNHPNTKFFSGDITNEETKKEIFDFFKGQTCDVIIGGPPCQGFSMAGRRDPKDPRNSLFMEFIKIVEKLKPKFFVIENVPGILTMETAKGIRVTEIIIQEFKKIGYKVHPPKKILAADYGVPQKRKRVFFIGTNTKKTITFPLQTHSKNPNIRCDGTFEKKWVPVSEVLISKEKVDKAFFHSQKMIEGFNKRKKRNLAKGHGFGAQFLKEDEPSYTISARYYKDGADALVKYSEKEIRMLTPEECAAIQTFPKKYKFMGSKRDIYTQIGNAVPCLLAKVIAEKIKEKI